MLTWGKMGEREECVGKEWGRSFLGSGRRGPHIHITLLNFPEKDNITFFLLLLEPWSKCTSNEGPWLFSYRATASPTACPLERQRTNWLFSYLCGTTWKGILFSSSLSPSLGFAVRTIYHNIKSQIPHLKGILTVNL